MKIISVPLNFSQSDWIPWGLFSSKLLLGTVNKSFDWPYLELLLCCNFLNLTLIFFANQIQAAFCIFAGNLRFLKKLFHWIMDVLLLQKVDKFPQTFLNTFSLVFGEYFEVSQKRTFFILVLGYREELHSQRFLKAQYLKPLNDLIFIKFLKVSEPKHLDGRKVFW